MIKWLKKAHKPEANVLEKDLPDYNEQQDNTEDKAKPLSLFAKFKQGLKKQRAGLVMGLLICC